jgi:hypothetical protein
MNIHPTLKAGRSLYKSRIYETNLHKKMLKNLKELEKTNH